MKRRDFLKMTTLGPLLAVLPKDMKAEVKSGKLPVKFDAGTGTAYFKVPSGVWEGQLVKWEEGKIRAAQSVNENVIGVALENGTDEGVLVQVYGIADTIIK